MHLLYYTSPNCSVCHSLKPKLAALLHEEFPSITMEVIDIATHPELAANRGVFAAPTIILLDREIEIYRRSGVFSLAEILSQFNRIIKLNT